MAVLIGKNGCRVASLREGAPEDAFGVRIWSHFGRAQGAEAISLRVLEFGTGVSPVLANPGCDEVLYVLDGNAEIEIDGHREQVSADTGLYLGPDAQLRVHNPGTRPLTLVGSRCPDPGSGLTLAGPELSSSDHPRSPRPFVRLDERVAEQTGDRWYRVLVDDRVGSTQVTQFVGAIPPGRAPDHFHEYEEVLCILAGAGRMWAGCSGAPIEPGSCIFLPRRQVHCVENTGAGELRLLGVFYPSGSPAVRYGVVVAPVVNW